MENDRLHLQHLKSAVFSIPAQALSVISEVGDLLQLKYSRHKIQPSSAQDRPDDGGDAYEDVED